ncbi:unnamed protein product, partial [marine sediment metagenome]
RPSEEEAEDKDAGDHGVVSNHFGCMDVSPSAGGGRSRLAAQTKAHDRHH